MNKKIRNIMLLGIVSIGIYACGNPQEKELEEAIEIEELDEMSKKLDEATIELEAETEKLEEDVDELLEGI